MEIFKTDHMPKNFQISQYDKAGGIPISSGGKIVIEMKSKKKTLTKEIDITSSVFKG